MADQEPSFSQKIEVVFFSYLDQKSYPLEVNWAAIAFKENVLGSDLMSDLRIEAPAIPARWMTMQFYPQDGRVDFLILSGPPLTMKDGTVVQEGGFYMPQTLIFSELGELRFVKARERNAQELELLNSERNMAKKNVSGLMKDRYRIISIIGEGGFSHVALAMDEKRGIQVAIKVIHHKISEDRDLMEKIMDRFFQEMKLLIQLDHPNVTRILDYGFDHGTWSPFYVMEYVDGKSLIHFSSQFEGDERWAVADRLLEQFLEGLGYLHDRGIVHRDLKPENVLVSGIYPDLQVKILDLGLAKMLNIKSYEYHMTDTQERETFGTPPYMSPEQCLNAKEVTPASDVYTAGILACILYSNQYPYEIDSQNSYEQMHVHVLPSLKRIHRLIPSSIYKLVERSLEKQPDLRFKNAREMASFWKKQESNRFFELLGIQSQSIQREWLTYLVVFIVIMMGSVLLFIYGYRYLRLNGWIP